MLYVERVRAWQYLAAAELPDWVADMVVEVRGDSLSVMDDVGGLRAMFPGNWLVFRPSGDISIISDADFQEFYAEAYPEVVDAASLFPKPTQYATRVP